MGYNTGNIKKHTTQNPLKRYMVKKLNEVIIKKIQSFRHQIGSDAITILDAGCGEGFIDRLLADHFPDVGITGLEYAEEAISIAEVMNPSVQYVQGDITQMPLKNNSYDIILCTEVLEHLVNPEKALDEMLRVAKRFLYITVPHEPWFCLGNLLVLKILQDLGIQLII